MIFSTTRQFCLAVYRHAIRLVFLFFVTITITTTITTTATALPVDKNWSQWLLKQVHSHPKILAARETKTAALHTADGQMQPIYNPTFDSEVQREGHDNNYTIGFSQSVDWWDKRGTAKRQAEFVRLAAQQTYQQALQSQVAQSLKSLTRWRGAKQQAQISLQQEVQLDAMIALVSERQNAGDLGEIDVELAYLSLSSRLNETAKAQALAKQETQLVYQLLPGLLSEPNGLYKQIPESFWDKYSSAFNPDHAIDLHPQVVTAKARWQVMQYQAELVDKQAKSDPTFGISGGQSGGENIVALSVSVPLFSANNFAAQSRAAYSEVLAAQADFNAIRRQKYHTIKGTKAALDEYQQRYQRWVLVVKNRLERSEALLDKQWRSGDLSTTEYLQALQQRAAGLVAGIELRTGVRLAQIDWLLQTGQLLTVLNGPSAQAATNKE